MNGKKQKHCGSFRRQADKFHFRKASKLMRKILPITIIFTLVLSGCASLLPSVDLNPDDGVDTERLYSPIELEDDLDYLLETLEDVHPNLYAFTLKDTIDALKNKIVSTISDSMTSFEFWKLVRPIVSKIGDGHTVLHFPDKFRTAYLKNGGLAIPFDVNISEGRIFVNSNYTSDTTLSINSEILSINNISTQKILKDMSRYESGERTEHKYIRIKKRFGKLLWALYDFDNNFNLEYISALNNQKYSKTFSGITLDAYKAINKAKAVKSKVIANSYKTIPGENIGIIDLRSFLDFSGFNAFLKSSFTQIQEEGIEQLIIDNRNNGGGNSQLADDFLQYITDVPYKHIERVSVKTTKKSKELFKKMWFKWYLYPLIPLAYLHPEGRNTLFKPDGTITEYEGSLRKIKKNPLRFNGSVYLLVGPWTYSSANLFTSIFKCEKMGLIIGEETGGLTVSYGDALIYNLPNTHLPGWVSRKKFFQSCGKEDGHGIIPDFVVKQTPEDREKGIDTVMEFTKELIRENQTLHPD